MEISTSRMQMEPRVSTTSTSACWAIHSTSITFDLYEELNAGKTLWNPQDVTRNYTLSNFVEDGSFLRLNDLTIGYTLPTTLTKKWGISRLRLYVTALTSCA